MSQVTIPDLSGKTVAQARSLLASRGLGLLVDGRAPRPQDDGAVIQRNDPARTTDSRGPGSTISIGGTVGVILV